MKKRSFPRFDVRMQAQFSVEGENPGWEECRITKISRKGMGITFKDTAKVREGSLIHVKVFTSERGDFFTLEGELRWLEKKENTLIGGIELTQVVNETKWLKLIYFIEDPPEKQTRTERTATRVNPATRSRRPPTPPKVSESGALSFIKSFVGLK